MVRRASATFSRELRLGRARSFSTWLRKGTDRPLRSATTARVRDSARRRRRTAAPTRRGCSLWSPIAPAPSLARRSDAVSEASSDEFSAPYACSANRFMRLSHPRHTACDRTSQFWPVREGPVTPDPRESSSLVFNACAAACVPALTQGLNDGLRSAVWLAGSFSYRDSTKRWAPPHEGGNVRRGPPLGGDRCRQVTRPPGSVSSSGSS